MRSPINRMLLRKLSETVGASRCNCTSRNPESTSRYRATPRRLYRGAASRIAQSPRSSLQSRVIVVETRRSRGIARECQQTRRGSFHIGEKWRVAARLKFTRPSIRLGVSFLKRMRPNFSHSRA